MYLKSRNKHKRKEIPTQTRQNRTRNRMSNFQSYRLHYDYATDSDDGHEVFEKGDDSWAWKFADENPPNSLNRRYLRSTSSTFYQHQKPALTRTLGLKTQVRI